MKNFTFVGSNIKIGLKGYENDQDGLKNWFSPTCFPCLHRASALSLLPQVMRTFVRVSIKKTKTNWVGICELFKWLCWFLSDSARELSMFSLTIPYLHVFWITVVLSQYGQFSFLWCKIEVLWATIIRLRSHAMILDFWLQTDVK